MEIWKEVVGYEGLYEVSNYGRVKRLARKENVRFLRREHKEEAILKNCIGNQYYIVGLRKNGKKKTPLVHRLIAQAFIPNPYNLPEVNHKDENKLNNHLDNLEWCTREYNINYGTCIERSVKHHDMKSVALKSALTQTKGEVIQKTRGGKFVKSWISTNEPKRINGYKQGHIYECCAGKRKTAHGYIWEWSPEVNADQRISG